MPAQAMSWAEDVGVGLVYLQCCYVPQVLAACPSASVQIEYMWNSCCDMLRQVSEVLHPCACLSVGEVEAKRGGEEYTGVAA